MKTEKYKNQFKKVICVQIGLLLSISCVNEKKDGNTSAFLAALLMKPKSSDSSSKEVKPQKGKPQKEKPKKPIELNITDPLYKDQWYLKNTFKVNLQGGGQTSVDINVEPVWKQGFLGKGMKVGILDSRVDSQHPDLKDNLPTSNVIKYFPDSSLCKDGTGEDHGTNVAGVIASKDNKVGTRGIAPHSTLYSYGVIKPNFSDYKLHVGKILEALNRPERNEISVYNGSLSDLAEEEYKIETNTTETAILRAFDEITSAGFGGLGSSLVFASGNESSKGANTAGNDFLNHYATIAVGTITKNGGIVETKGQQLANAATNVGSTGPNLWLIAPAGKAFGRDKIMTTYPRCKPKDPLWFLGFNASSSATPMVTGIIALLREAYPKLTWRDVKLILAESAKKIAANLSLNSDWEETGKMYSDPTKNQSYHQSMGFGLVDAGAALNLAKNWKLLPPMKKETFEKNETLNTETDDVLHISELEIGNSEIQFIESVVIDMEISRTPEVVNYYWTLSLVSPDNKTGWIYRELEELDDRVLITSGITKLRFSVNAFLGSSVKGTWKLRLQTSSKRYSPEPDTFKNRGKIREIKNWKITFRGH